MAKEKKTKPKKKHRILKLFGVLLVIFAGLLVIGNLSGDDDYTDVETENESTKLVTKLSAGGDSLATDYDGE